MFKISKSIWIFYTLGLCCIFKLYLNCTNALTIVRWLCRLSLQITKSKPLCQSWNYPPLPSSDSFGFLALNTTFYFTKRFRKYVDEMADCNKISLKFAHLMLQNYSAPFPHL